MTPSSSYRFRYRQHAEALYGALVEDSFYQAIEDSIVGRPAREAMVRYFDFSMRQAQEAGRLVTLDTAPFGAAVWILPRDSETVERQSRERSRFLEQEMGPETLRLYERSIEAMARETGPHVPESHWYLSILGVEVGGQNRGLGRRLMEPTLREADEAGVSTFLETFTARNRTFYRRLGYRETACPTEPVTGASYWVMVRPPGGSGLESELLSVSV